MSTATFYIDIDERANDFVEGLNKEKEVEKESTNNEEE